jgi:hypothetical protein
MPQMRTRQSGALIQITRPSALMTISTSSTAGDVEGAVAPVEELPVDLSGGGVVVAHRGAPRNVLGSTF